MPWHILNTHRETKQKQTEGNGRLLFSSGGLGQHYTEVHLACGSKPSAGEKVKMKTQRDLTTRCFPHLPAAHPTSLSLVLPLLEPALGAHRMPPPPALATFIIPDLSPSQRQTCSGLQKIYK